MFNSVITSLPVTNLKKLHTRIEENNDSNLLKSLATNYKNKTGITITNEYELHIFHINEILKWEETKVRIGPFFTSALLDGHEDPLTYLSKLLVTARVRKNIIVIETEDINKINQIKNQTLKFAIESETIFI